MQKYSPWPVHHLLWFAGPRYSKWPRWEGRIGTGSDQGRGGEGGSRDGLGHGIEKQTLRVWNTRDRQQIRNPTRLARGGGHGARGCCIVGTQSAGLTPARMPRANKLCVNGHDLALPVAPIA